jgi:ferredoxin-NADP reductase
MKAKLIKVSPETEDIASFIFEPERSFERLAGQFLRYVLPHTDMDDRHDDRYFTIASAPYEGYLQITTRFTKNPSSFKQTLRQLAVGAELHIDEQAEGDFVVTHLERNYIFVAGGIGITPFRAILTEAQHNGQKLKAQVLYGNHDKQILFKEELDDLAQQITNLHIDYVVGAGGITTEILKEAIESTDNPYVYLSGPGPMVEALAVTVKKLGLDIGHIQTDFFTGYNNN